MFKHALFLVALGAPLSIHAAENTDLQTLNDKIRQLEQRVEVTEQNTSAPSQAAKAASTANASNPAISLILSGTYGSMTQTPNDKITGFEISPNEHGYSRGFNLGESELGFSANIDSTFRGVATFAIDSSSISVENAYVQTTSLGNGLNLKFGRFFSGLGYLNELHAHTWDFVDQPLVYRVFWDKQMGDDGVQLKWLAPTDTFLELGVEIGQGRAHPGSNRTNNNGSNAQTFFAHMGDDVNTSNSWRAGISAHQTRRVDAEIEAFDVTNKFNADSLTTGADFVWKYAPNGNSKITHLKFQAEYFQRKEYGLLTYDTKGTPITDTYGHIQSGWYAQSVYQFMPRWRIAYRHDQLNAGNAEVGATLTNVPASTAFIPTRQTVMLDYSPSEFSRLRLQLAHEKTSDTASNDMLFMQYIMSLGAHSPHKY